MADRTAICVLWAGIACSTVQPIRSVLAGPPAESAAPSADQPDGDKQMALRWLQQYRPRQVLFYDEDIDRLVRKLAQATPEQARKWLDETREIRAALDSPRWQNTQQWLKEFFKVQAIYSDEQIDQLHRNAKRFLQESPRKFIGLLNEIEDKRARMVAGAKSARHLREQKLALVRAYKQQQMAQRPKAFGPAGFSTVGPASARPAARPRRARPPLISSMDVARWTVARNFWNTW